LTFAWARQEEARPHSAAEMLAVGGVVVCCGAVLFWEASRFFFFFWLVLKAVGWVSWLKEPQECRPCCA
jgi:hypothetical protein